MELALLIQFFRWGYLYLEHIPGRLFFSKVANWPVMETNRHLKNINDSYTNDMGVETHLKMANADYLNMKQHVIV